MRFHSYAVLGLAAVLAAGTASAQDRADRFVERDQNRDGVLSQEEYVSTGGHPGNFRALDVNGDGVLSRGEFVDRSGAVEGAAVPAAPGGVLPNIFRPADRAAAGPDFQRLDTNRDSVLQRAEWTGTSADYRRMDTDSDRVVTAAEWVAYERAVGQGQLVKYREFPVLDYNHDGRLNQREWNGDRVTFDRMDVNRDGWVTAAEYQAYDDGALVKDRRQFGVLDYDNDGVLSRREWNGDRVAFDRMDVNNDGVVSYREYEAPAVSDDARGLRFRELDRNRDGWLTRAEWATDRMTFDTLDRNRDGRLTSSEFADLSGLDAQFYRLDRDRDGMLQRGEWTGTSSTFRTLDRNRDGRLSRDEFLL
jgi:Ca2+-binding EF-hand superfamily protein